MSHTAASRRKSILAWCLFDAGNSAFSTVIVTFVFSVYFTRSVIGDETEGSALWGMAVAAAGFTIALLSPVLGAVADHYGARKPGAAVFTLLCVIATALLFFIPPEASPSMIAAALVLLLLANIGFEMAQVFTNAMLPHIAPPAMIGRVSGWAWGAGYLGGLLCLVLALVGLVGVGGLSPLLDLPQENAMHVRATAPLAALWFAVLALPLLLWTQDTARSALTLRQAVGKGLGQLAQTLRTVRTQGNLVLFLIASALYRDGLGTLFAMGGVFAAGVYGMDFTEILIFAIGLNVTAGLGAILFSFLDDRMGSRRTVMLALAGLIGTGLAVLLADDKTVFIALALLLGIFVGPAQAASRTLAARLSPAATVVQTFGLYAFTGKSVAFLGPLLYGVATKAFDTQRAGMAIIILFWLGGLVLLAMVRENGNHPAAD